MEDKKIKIAVKAADVVPFSRLKIIQDDLKSLSDENFQALCAEIMEKDFSFAFHVWDDGADLCVLDGTQRHRVISHLLEHGYTDSDGVHWGCQIDGVPVNYVEARDLKSAVLKLLGAAGSYGKPEQEGLYALMHKFEIEPIQIKTVRLSGIPVERFLSGHFEPLPDAGGDGLGQNKEGATPDLQTCPNCGVVIDAVQ